MNRKNIHKFSPGFALLSIFVWIFHRLYYRKLRSNGLENIPKNRPVLFAINHQNALMDPLAVIFTTHRQMVFYARADIFRNKSIARILHFLKILPVYRPRDGFRSVEQNQEVFEEGIRVMQKNCPVAILPEGNHIGQKRLRPLHKGAARLALLTEDQAEFKLGLSIVPVGLDYANYFVSGADLLVNFGEPFTVSHYKDLYHENPPRAVSRLTEELSSAMKKVMIDIESEKYYDDLFLATEILIHHHQKTKKKKIGLYPSYILKKNITEKFNELYRRDPGKIAEIVGSCSAYAGELNRLNLQEKTVSKGKQALHKILFKTFMMLVAFPVYANGTIIHYLPYRISTRISRKLNDPYLRASVRFGASFVLFTILYLLLAIVFLLVPLSIPIKLLLLVSVPVSGVISFYYHGYLRKIAEEWRWMRIWKNDRKKAERIIQMRNKIIEMASGMMKE